eukprot:TRINITY_DN38566_c0_g1_i1.p1 TRINITY_DN38566_c0_g1~~TRINITY_DN38566_c0_g1_i1.p1  ORF type:complete len:575 (+),score=134.33 TRINITY_DN38566_c0_g1_i1:135-1859(+)
MLASFSLRSRLLTRRMCTVPSLTKHATIRPPAGPVCLIILDGVGLGDQSCPGNAWARANTPFLDKLFFESAITGAVAAHGVAVGMPSDEDMGNSEVGHNALGAGRVFDQGAKLVQCAVESGDFKGDTWNWLMDGCAEKQSTFHLIGLWSDGNVHSNLQHAYAMVEAALAQGASKIRLHVLLDGRDVAQTSALEYILPLEARMDAWNAAGADVQVASGGGRMVTTMDRYDANWPVVERGWNAHVHGEAEHTFSCSASQAIAEMRGEGEGLVTDQFLPAFVRTDEGGAPVGRIEDGDSVVLFNYRGDRAQQISKAFEQDDEFEGFDRKARPQVRYAGIMQYDGDNNLPERYIVTPPAIDRTVGELVAGAGLRQLAISETQKFGHVTYFFNGNRNDKFNEEKEVYIEIPSYIEPENERPWMKAAEVTDACLKQLDDFKPDFVRLNYPNGDMVGHTGCLRSAIMGMEAVDLCCERLVKGIIQRGGVALVTADHGNADEMVTRAKDGSPVQGDSPEGFKPLTSHTLAPVPVAVVGAATEGLEWDASVQKPGLANLSATCLNLLGYETPEFYLPSVLKQK